MAARNRNANQLPFVFIALLISSFVFSGIPAQPLDDAASPPDSSGHRSSTSASIGDVGPEYQTDQRPQAQTPASQPESPASQPSARQSQPQSQDTSRPLTIEGNTFDFRFQPKTTGKGSWTAIKIWNGDEKRTSRADRVISSSAHLSSPARWIWLPLCLSLLSAF